MIVWWQGLTADCQWFFVAASAFSMVFIAQFIMSLLGWGDHGNMDVSAHMDAGAAGGAHDVADTTAGFHYISARSVLAFCTLFSWSAFLYRANSTPIEWALLYSALWGLAAMTLVAFVIHWLWKLQETGTPRMSTAVGAHGTVYGNIPAGGTGEVRVLVSGVVTVVRARGEQGREVPAGTEIVVTRVIDDSTLEVKKA